MTKRSVQTLAFALLATPLLWVGCGGDSNSNGTGGTGGGGAGGTGGAKLDAHPADALATVDTGAADGVAAVDAGLGSDATMAPDTASATDTSAPDVAATLDTANDVAADPLDVAAADAPAPVDAGTAVDTGAVDTGAVACAMVPAFVGGAITAPLTLTEACSPYTITDNIDVDGSNAVLTIEPGVRLNFEQSIGINIGPSGAGKLVAVGTAQSPIIFTSAASTPSDGDWSNIYFWAGTMGGSQIAYAKVDYCGAGGYGCIVGFDVKPSRVTLDHLTIAHVGASANAITEFNADSNFVITNSTLGASAHRYAISVQAQSFAGIGAGNVFTDGAIIELGGGTVTATTSWLDPGTAVAVTGGLSVDGSGTPVLTLGPGITLKFDADIALSVGISSSGKLVMAGTATKPVVLTSLSTSPSPGDWKGVQVWGGGKAAISYADISYAGSAGTTSGEITLGDGNSTSQLSVDHTSLTYSLGYGIYLPCTASTGTPLAQVTIDATNTYAHNAVDSANANTKETNVGPGLDNSAAACQ
jgi:hypothetical protein